MRSAEFFLNWLVCHNRVHITIELSPICNVNDMQYAKTCPENNLNNNARNPNCPVK